MPIIVTCQCGKSFQAQDQHAGLQAKCKVCGAVLLIKGPQVKLAAEPVPIQPFNTVAQPYDASAEEPADEGGVSPQAAAVLRQREMQAEADKRFMIKMAFIFFGLLIVGGIGAGIYSMTSEPVKKVAKKTDDEPAPDKKPPVTAVVAPVDTKPKPVEPVKPEPPKFDKRVLGSTASREVKWSGQVASGLADDGAIIVALNTETLQSGSTVTYRAKLKLKQPLDRPIPSGTEISFAGTLQPGMGQTEDFHESNGTRLVDVVYTMTVSDASISSQGGGDTTPAGAAAGQADDVERYILFAVQSKDGHNKQNARMFKPSDPRLEFQHTDRQLPKDAPEKVHTKTDPIASMEDMDAGPAPTAKTDQIEARMLMDKDLVGDGLWLDADTGKSKFFVFLSDPLTIMQEVRQKYGQPEKSLKSGDKCRLHFYGRMMLVELSDGRVFAVLRKMIAPQ